MSMNAIAWALAGATAVWFALLAVRSGKNWALWGLAGGCFALVSSTCIFGLGHAAAIPFSDRERAALHVEWTLVAVAVILLVGGLLTWNIRRKPRGTVPGKQQPVAAEKQAVKNAP